MDHRVGPPLLEGTGGLERRLDGTDPAAEGVVPAEERELALGGGDDEHHGADRISGKARGGGRSWPPAWGSRSRSTPRARRPRRRPPPGPSRSGSPRPRRPRG